MWPGSITKFDVISGSCLFSSPHREVFLLVLRFPLFSKTNIWLDLRSLLISVSPISAQALERLYTYSSFLFPFLSCINDIDEIRMTLNFTCWKKWNNNKAADNIDKYTWFGLTLTRCFPNLPWKTATTEMEIFCLREMFNTWNLFAFWPQSQRTMANF